MLRASDASKFGAGCLQAEGFAGSLVWDSVVLDHVQQWLWKLTKKIELNQLVNEIYRQVDGTTSNIKVSFLFIVWFCIFCLVWDF